MSEFRILIVEDEVDAAEIMESLLSHYQLQTVIVGTGEAAREALEQDAYDVVIADIMLPQMDGLELIKWLRCNPQTAQIPCIAITAYNSSTLRKEALAAGFNRYFSKPLNTEELIAVLRGFLA